MWPGSCYKQANEPTDKQANRVENNTSPTSLADLIVIIGITTTTEVGVGGGGRVERRGGGRGERGRTEEWEEEE